MSRAITFNGQTVVANPFSGPAVLHDTISDRNPQGPAELSDRRFTPCVAGRGPALRKNLLAFPGS